MRNQTLVRSVVLALLIVAVAMIGLLWWGLFALPTDPFGGMSSAAGLVVTYLNIPPESSPIHVGDVVVSIRGYTLREWNVPDIDRTVRLLRSQAGETATYTVRRNGESFAVSLPLTRVEPAEGLKRILLILPVVLASLVMGAFVAWRRPDDAAARVIGLFFFAVVLNVVDDSVNEANTTWLLAFNTLIHLVEIVTFWFVASLGLHFSLIFPRPHSWLERYPWLVWAIHLINPIVSITIAITSGDGLFGIFATAPETARYVTGGALVIWALVNLVHSFRTARTPIERAQMRWLAWGTAVGIFPWLVGFILPLIIGGLRLGIVQTAILWLLLAAMPVSVAFAVLRYRLMDIDAVINRSLVYAALSAVVVGIYLFLATALGWLLVALSGQADNTTVVFLSTLGAALMIAPARTRIQQGIDRLFYRQQVNLPALLAEWSKTLATTLDRRELAHLLEETAPSQLGVERAALWRWEGESACFVAMDGTVAAQGQPAQAMQQTLLAARQPVVVNPPDRPPDATLTPLRAHHLEVAVPLVVGTELAGVYAVGAKQSGAWYNRRDLEFLETLGAQAALALENACLMEQLAEQERLKRDLEIAREIQTSLLPAASPQWPGLDVYGLSLPAREVGGDFYTYLTLPDGAAAIAVGDVSGKGVPGALFMAVALGVMRAQAPAFQNAAELLQALNVALYEQMISTHMNVAIVYAILQPESDGRCKLRTSNGGLIAPLVLLHHGACEYMDATGLPLGAALYATFDQIETTLMPGDMVALCSDGIVEAMNADRQLFGFARLQQTLYALRDHSAAEVARGLVEAARQFAGGVEFEDDVTLVVVKVEARREQDMADGQASFSRAIRGESL